MNIAYQNSPFVKHLIAKTGKHKAICYLAVCQISDCIAQWVADGDKVVIRGLGSFQQRKGGKTISPRYKPAVTLRVRDDV